MLWKQFSRSFTCLKTLRTLKPHLARPCFTQVKIKPQEMASAQFVIPNNVDVCVLDCATAFSGLTAREKQYAHYISQASWYGSLVCLYQTSPESPGIFLLLQKLFRAQSADEIKKLAEAQGLDEEEVRAFMVYAAAFYANLGNYKSFGDTKFVPNLPKDKFEAVIKASAAYAADPETMEGIWQRIAGKIYSLSPREQELGLGAKGTTTYFSANCDTPDAELCQEFMDSKELSAYNTRLFKTVQGNGEVVYDIRLAAANKEAEGAGDYQVLGTHSFTGKGRDSPVTFRVTRGDYSPIMQRIVDNLSKAQEFVANETEGKMLDRYVESFRNGSINAHKDGSRYWIRNQSPIVETYIGFIESYRDPFGVRGEFEGFVAMVNKEMSAKFGELVAHAEHFLPLLPWPAAYEKDKFLKPDFTSLDVLTFGSSGIPAGINIPNYDDIRQEEGSKNVSLGNVLSAGYKDTKVTFLGEADKELYSRLKAPSFEVQVGLHELLGHGSGKLFIQNDDGTFNFDQEHVKHTETGEQISSWYKGKETWDGKFKSLSSSYEECRAECVGIYLCLSSEILKIFGHHGSAADDIIYINWLNMVRAGLLALEFYTPETQAWKQAHMQARYVILRVLLEAGDALVTVEKLTNPTDGEADLIISLDRSKINTTGKEAIGNFLRKLQVYKSTGDYESGSDMFMRYSEVNDHDAPHFLSLRSIVLARKQPRKMFVQSNTQLKGEEVQLVEYENSAENLIQSYVDRFPAGDLESQIGALWMADAKYF